MSLQPETTSRSKRGKGVLLTIGLLSLMAALAAGAEWARRKAFAERATWPAEADTRYLPPSEALRVASLGHHELAADLVAARTNIYFGEQMETKGPQLWLKWYLNTVVDLDPHFEPIYLRGASMLTYGMGEVRGDNIVAATQLLRRGLEAFPNSWDLYFQLGFNLYFELPQFLKGDERIAGWRKEGIEMLRKATLFDDAPPWMANLVAGMLTKDGHQELAIKHLEQIYAVTSDPEARANIEGKMNQLQGEHYAATFAKRAKRLERVVQTRFPYAPEAFSLLVGQRFEPYAPLNQVLADPADHTP